MEKKVKSEIIYDGKIIKVYKDQVECPNKRLATREIVRHHGGVGILAVVDDCILLVKQFRYAYNKDTLEIPAGKLELGEEAGPAPGGHPHHRRYLQRDHQCHRPHQ